MADTTIVNKFGKVIGWNSMSAHFMSRDIEAFDEIEYDDNVEIEGVKGAGPFDFGYGVGNYQAKASITLYEEERRAILDSIPPGTFIWELPPFPIVVQYEYRGKIYTDVIRDCVFKNNGVALKQGDKSSKFKFEIYTPLIEWNKRAA